MHDRAHTAIIEFKELPLVRTEGDDNTPRVGQLAIGTHTPPSGKPKSR